MISKEPECPQCGRRGAHFCTGWPVDTKDKTYYWKVSNKEDEESDGRE